MTSMTALETDMLELAAQAWAALDTETETEDEDEEEGGGGVDKMEKLVGLLREVAAEEEDDETREAVGEEEDEDEDEDEEEDDDDDEDDDDSGNEEPDGVMEEAEGHDFKTPSPMKRATEAPGAPKGKKRKVEESVASKRLDF